MANGNPKASTASATILSSKCRDLRAAGGEEGGGSSGCFIGASIVPASVRQRQDAIKPSPRGHLLLVKSRRRSLEAASDGLSSANRRTPLQESELLGES